MGSFTVTRSIDIKAEPGACHALVDDLHAWPEWSPWQDVDPEMERTYSGPVRGVGARSAWSGNRKAGQGSMEIVGSSAERIDVHLVFERPWKAENSVEFHLVPTGVGTHVTWTMSGENRGVSALFARVVNMDKLLGRDFEKGLSRLKGVAEQR